MRSSNSIAVSREEIMGYRGVVLLFTLILVPSWSFPQEKDAARARYNEIVAKLKVGDKNVDFKELRVAYAGTIHTADTDPQKKAMTAALNAKKFDEAIKNADAILAADYADMDAHLGEYIAYRGLQNSEQADFHKFVLKGLLDSIAKSADGKSFETAFEVIEVDEEYVLLRFMGLMPSKQSTSEKNGHSFDVLETVNPKTNEKVTLYFNIDIEEKHLRDALKN